MEHSDGDRAGQKTNPGLSSLKRVVAGLSTAILVVCTLLCFVVVIRTALNQDASLFGYRLFYVVSGSMEPTLPVNSLLIVKARDSYEVGEIITFYAKDAAISGHPNTHRIIAKDAQSGGVRYVTQGDANPGPDPDTVTHAEIIGKVCFHLETTGVVGTVIGFAGTRLGFFLMVLTPILLIAVACMRDFKRAFQEELERAAKQSLSSGRHDDILP